MLQCSSEDEDSDQEEESLSSSSSSSAGHVPSVDGTPLNRLEVAYELARINLVGRDGLCTEPWEKSFADGIALGILHGKTGFIDDLLNQQRAEFSNEDTEFFDVFSIALDPLSFHGEFECSSVETLLQRIYNSDHDTHLAAIEHLLIVNRSSANAAELVLGAMKRLLHDGIKEHLVQGLAEGYHEVH